VTKECLAPINSGKTPDYGPIASLRLNCSANGVKFNGTGAFGESLCALDVNGSCVKPEYQIPSK